jgi:hypothetical protein
MNIKGLGQWDSQFWRELEGQRESLYGDMDYDMD